MSPPAPSAVGHSGNPQMVKDMDTLEAVLENVGIHEADDLGVVEIEDVRPILVCWCWSKSV